MSDANNSWYYGGGGKAVGPFAWPELCDLARSGIIRADAMVWNGTSGDRVRAAEIPGLLKALSAAPPPARKPGPPPAPRPTSNPPNRERSPGAKKGLAPDSTPPSAAKPPAKSPEANVGPVPESTPPAAPVDPVLERLRLVAVLAVTVPLLVLMFHHWAFYAGAGWQLDDTAWNLIGIAIFVGIPLGQGAGWLVRFVSRIPIRGRRIHPDALVYATVAFGALWGIGLVYSSHRSLAKDRQSFLDSLAWAARSEQEGKWTYAVMAYNSALKIGHTAEVFYRRACAHRRLGQMDLALNDLNTAIILKSDYAVAYSMRADMHEARGDPVLAKLDRDRAAELNTTQ